jgi:sodium transport system permease protein
MSWRSILTIYGKELRDTLRDRRTLISMIVVPTLVMPVLILGAGQAASSIVTRARAEVPRIMVIGGDDSPGVVADLRRAGKFQLVPPQANWKTLIADKRLRAAVEIPPGFEKGLAAGGAPAVTIDGYQGELKSGLATEQLEDYFAGVRSRATSGFLAARGLPATLAHPFDIKQVNVAPPEKVGGNLVGGVVPYIIIIMCLIGSIYPAIDLTAGEKERGTLETLLCAPTARTDIVLGKFLMVLTGALAASLFSLASLGGTLAVLAAAIAPGRGGSLPAIDPLGILGVLVMVVPVAVLFSAVVFAVALFAKSQKEAQSYLTPIMMAVVVPSGVAILPGIDLGLGLALVPIVNVSLVCKEMLSGVWHWHYLAIIFASTALYAAAALAWAVRMFRREDVVFRT